MRPPVSFALVLGLGLAACSSSSHGTIDGPPDGTSIKISGTTGEVGISGATPISGVKIEAYSNTDDTTVVATAMSDDAGNYTLTITGDAANLMLDGYLKATKTSYKTTYVYAPKPITADYAGGTVKMVTPGVFNILAGFAMATQTGGMGFVALIVDPSDTPGVTPIAGASVSSTPVAGGYRYNGANGLPTDSSTTVTAADGIAYMFNVPPGQVTLSATKAGSTFTSHIVNARPDVLTTTIIIP